MDLMRETAPSPGRRRPARAPAGTSRGAARYDFAMRERALLPSVASILTVALAFGPAMAGACALLCGEVGGGGHGSASSGSAHAGHAGPERPADDDREHESGHGRRHDRAAAPASGSARVGVGATVSGCCDHPGIRETRPAEAVAAEESLTAGLRAAKGSLPVAPAPREGAFRSRSGAAPPGNGRAMAPGFPRTVVLRL